MVIHAVPASRGSHYIMADQRGSYGEVRCVRVGRMYMKLEMAMRRANELAKTHHNVVVMSMEGGREVISYIPN